MSKASTLRALAGSAARRRSPASPRCALISPTVSPIGTVLTVLVGMNPPKNEVKRPLAWPPDTSSSASAPPPSSR